MGKVKLRAPSSNIRDVLVHISKMGFYLKTVFDVGVTSGTYPRYETFPAAFHLLIEPLEEFSESIKSILCRYEGVYILAAASSKDGEIELNVHPDHLEGSSVLKEEMGTEFDGVPRTVKSVRIDTIVKEKTTKAPYLLKIDVQGGELEVLDGAQQTLDCTEIILLEVSLFEFMKSAPQFTDVVLYMKEHGFVAYDIYGRTNRPLNGALGQIDIAFVKESGMFRMNHCYATPEQWKDFVSH